MSQGEPKTRLPETGGANGSLAFSTNPSNLVPSNFHPQISITMNLSSTKDCPQKPQDNAKLPFVLSSQNKSSYSRFTTEAEQKPTQGPHQEGRQTQDLSQRSQQSPLAFSGTPQEKLSLAKFESATISLGESDSLKLADESVTDQKDTFQSVSEQKQQSEQKAEDKEKLQDVVRQEIEVIDRPSQNDIATDQHVQLDVKDSPATAVTDGIVSLAEKAPDLQPVIISTASDNKAEDVKPERKGHKSKEAGGDWVPNKPNKKNKHRQKEVEPTSSSTSAPITQPPSSVPGQKTILEISNAEKEGSAPAPLPEPTTEASSVIPVETLLPQTDPELDTENQASRPQAYNARKHHEEKAKVVEYKKLIDPGERRVSQSDFMAHLLLFLEPHKELSSFKCNATGTELSYRDVLLRMDSEIADPATHNTKKQLSAAISHYFDVAKTTDIEKYLTNERAGDMPQIVKLMIKGDETNFERTTLLSIRDKLNKVTKETVKQVHVDIVKLIRGIPNLDSPYQKIFLLKAIFDEIIDKACMEPNFVSVYTDLLFALLDNPRGRNLQGDKDAQASQTNELSVAPGFLEVIRILAELKDDAMFPDLRYFRETVQKNKDKIGDDKPLKGFMVNFFREYMLRANMAEEIKTGQTHNPVFNIYDSDSDEVKAIKEQNKLVHLSNNVKFLASIFTKDLLDFYRKERRQQKRMNEKTRGPSSSITKKSPTNMLIPIAQFVTLISSLLRRQFDRTIDNYYAETKNKSSSTDILRTKEEMKQGFPEKGSITIDDVDRKTPVYKSALARLQKFTEQQYKDAWSSEYMDLIVIILRTGGLAMDNYDHSTYEYALYVYCMDILQLLLEKRIIEVRIQVLLTEILEDRSGGWKGMQKTLNYETGPVKPSRPEREPDEDTPAAVRENGLRYTIAFNLGFLNANINNKEVDLFSDGMMEKWCKQVELTTQRMVFDGSTKIMYDELPNLFPSRSEDEIFDLYRAFAKGLVKAYSPMGKTNQHTNKDVVSTLASLFISDKIRFPCLFPFANRVDPSDLKKGYEGSIEPQNYQLAVEVMRHCIERAIQGTIADNEFDFSESEMDLLRAEYVIEDNYKAEKGPGKREKGLAKTPLKKTPSNAMLELLKQRKCGLFGEPDIEGHEGETVDFLEQNALDTIADILFLTKYPTISYEKISTGCTLYDKLLSLTKEGKYGTGEFHAQTSMPHLEKFLVHDLQFPTSICFLVCDEINRDPNFIQKYMNKPSEENPLLIGKTGQILLDRLFTDFCEKLDKGNKVSPYALAESLAAQPVLRIKRAIVGSMKSAVKKATDQNKAMKLMIAAVVSKDFMKLEEFKDMVKADKNRRYGKTFAGLEETSQWVEAADDSAIMKLIQPSGIGVTVKTNTKEVGSDKSSKEAVSGSERPQYCRSSDYHRRDGRQAGGDRFTRQSIERNSGHGSGHYRNNKHGGAR